MGWIGKGGSEKMEEREGERGKEREVEGRTPLQNPTYSIRCYVHETRAYDLLS